MFKWPFFPLSPNFLPRFGCRVRFGFFRSPPRLRAERERHFPDVHRPLLYFLIRRFKSRCLSSSFPTQRPFFYYGGLPDAPDLIVREFFVPYCMFFYSVLRTPFHRRRSKRFPLLFPLRSRYLSHLLSSLPILRGMSVFPQQLKNDVLSLSTLCFGVPSFWAEEVSSVGFLRGTPQVWFSRSARGRSQRGDRLFGRQSVFALLFPSNFHALTFWRSLVKRSAAHFKWENS